MTTRPEMGTLEIGQPVIVRRSSNDSRRRNPEENYIPAVVTKVGRVWVEMERSNLVPSQIGYRTWRMRMDTQNEDSQYPGNNASFATPEQHAWDETRIWAHGVLKDNGIRLDSGSNWSGREAELADLVTKGRNDDGN